MSRGELTAWGTGVGVERTQAGDPEAFEATAYLTGVARAQMGRGITGFLCLSRADLGLMLTDDAFRAAVSMSRDAWAYWVRRGYEAARTGR